MKQIAAPGWVQIMLESRAWWELGATIMNTAGLQGMPYGDGHPVIVLPGLATGDFSTMFLRNYISQRGYQAYAWQMGLNLGPRPGVIEQCLVRVRQLAKQHNEAVSLIGWSLGGIYAREIAKMQPEAVRQVITLGTPFTGNPKASNAWRFYELASGQNVERDICMEELRKTPPVPTTSIYSRTDGIVAWQCCLEQETPYVQNIEIDSSHFGMPMNSMALQIIADRLAQPHGAWQRYDNQRHSGRITPLSCRVAQH